MLRAIALSHLPAEPSLFSPELAEPNWTRQPGLDVLLVGGNSSAVAAFESLSTMPESWHSLIPFSCLISVDGSPGMHQPASI